MTLEIALVLAILVAAVVLFVSEWIAMDLVALLVLGAVALTGLVSPVEAVAGFSNPAVITVWAMFMISAALSRTGIADLLGRQVLRLAGTSEGRLVAVIMLTSGVLSAFMNNIGVAALMLPVVMDVAQRAGHAPSRLLMPLAYGSLLGGLTTLIGTPPNLLVSGALESRGLAPFGLFDYTPIGGIAFLAGIVFVALVGRRLLPAHAVARPTGRAQRNLPEQYGLHERAVVLRVVPGSPLVGRSLAESRIGSAAELNVIAIIRNGRTEAAPTPDVRLAAGDRLLVGGRLDRFRELGGWRELVVEERDLAAEQLVAGDVCLAELRVAPESPFAGRTLGQVDFRNRFGGVVLALSRGGSARHTDLAATELEPGDRLLLQIRRDDLERLRAKGGATVAEIDPEPALLGVFSLRGHLFSVRVPQNSVLTGRGLAESRLGDALRLGVLGIVRGKKRLLLPAADEPLQAGDRLLVRGEREDLAVLRGLQGLAAESDSPQRVEALESEQIGFVEAVLSPRTSLAGRTLRELAFRERHGVQALAILRDGRARRSQIGDVALRFGDALLLFGRRERLELLASDSDLLVLSRAVQPPPRTERAPRALAILVAVIVPVLAGWTPIAIAAVIGAALMVLTRCLTMEEAYRSVEWRSIFLIAGMLPLGAAMHETGAASLVAELVLGAAGPLGPWGVIVALYAITALATSIIPTAALVVLMAPIALRAASELGISPHAVMMAVAMAASASFTSPISHPANVLVMGPGGYRFVDYFRLGLPLTLVVMAVVLLVLPLLWPLQLR